MRELGEKAEKRDVLLLRLFDIEHQLRPAIGGGLWNAHRAIAHAAGDDRVEIAFLATRILPRLKSNHIDCRPVRILISIDREFTAKVLWINPFPVRGVRGEFLWTRGGWR